MVLNALERIRQTRGVEININLELTKNEKKCFCCHLRLVMSMVLFFVYLDPWRVRCFIIGKSTQWLPLLQRDEPRALKNSIFVLPYL